MGFTMSLLILTACNSGNTWSSAADCEALSAGEDRDNCWTTYAPDVFRQDRSRGEKIVEEQISSPLTQDFIWLTVTREVYPGSNQYCERIQESALKERCSTLVSRPHLHRELLKEQGGAPPGGAPQGGAPQGGVPQGGALPGGPPPGGQPPQ